MTWPRPRVGHLSGWIERSKLVGKQTIAAKGASSGSLRSTASISTSEGRISRGDVAQYLGDGRMSFRAPRILRQLEKTSRHPRRNAGPLRATLLRESPGRPLRQISLRPPHSSDADHRLTTETPRTNGDKDGQTPPNIIVFVDLSDRSRRFKSRHSDQKSLGFLF